MGKLVLFTIILIIILLFPIYENSKIFIPIEKNLKKEIALAIISKGTFSVYDINLSKRGKFDTFFIYKNRYIVNELNVDDIEKNESYFAKKAILKNKILTAFNFNYRSPKYSFVSDFVIYNLKTKNIRGRQFFLYSDEYNSTGKKFFIDSKRDISAENISFYLKVKK